MLKLFKAACPCVKNIYAEHIFMPESIQTLISYILTYSTTLIHIIHCYIFQVQALLLF